MARKKPEPKPCAQCGEIGQYHRRGLCGKCYARYSYDKNKIKAAVEKANVIPNGSLLTDLEKFVWINSDKYSTEKICQMMQCSSRDVKNAFNHALFICAGSSHG
jgi:hypothetical protein